MRGLSCSAVPHFVLTPSGLEPCLHGLCLMRCSYAMLLAVHVQGTASAAAPFATHDEEGGCGRKRAKTRVGVCRVFRIELCCALCSCVGGRLPHATAACASFCSPLCLIIVCPHRRSRLSRAEASRSSPSRPGGLNCHRLRFGFMLFLAVSGA